MFHGTSFTPNGRCQSLALWLSAFTAAAAKAVHGTAPVRQTCAAPHCSTERRDSNELRWAVNGSAVGSSDISQDFILIFTAVYPSRPNYKMYQDMLHEIYKKIYEYYTKYQDIPRYGGVLKWGTPKSSMFHRIFQPINHPASLGYLNLWKHLYAKFHIYQDTKLWYPLNQVHSPSTDRILWGLIAATELEKPKIHGFLELEISEPIY
jgi:hypothetical protein